MQQLTTTADQGFNNHQHQGHEQQQQQDSSQHPAQAEGDFYQQQQHQQFSGDFGQKQQHQDFHNGHDSGQGSLQEPEVGVEAVVSASEPSVSGVENQASQESPLTSPDSLQSSCIPDMTGPPAQVSSSQPPMDQGHSQEPLSRVSPAGPEVPPPGQVFFPAGVASPALISFSPATPAASTPAAALEPSPGAPDLQPGHPLGPPDLVDHRPNSSQPELVSDLSAGPSNQVGGPPDLTRPRPSPNLVSHDQHYEFYSQAYTHSQQGRTLPLLTVDHDKHILQVRACPMLLAARRPSWVLW